MNESGKPAMATVDVEHLLSAVRTGEPEAYRSLVRALSEPLFRYVSGIVREPETAQDVVQQTFIRLFKARARLQTGGTLRGYCYRVAGNLAKNALRDARLRRERESQAMSTTTAPGSDPELAAMAREAWAMAHTLPAELKEPLVLRFEHGLSLAETAQALEVPEGTVSTRQRTGLERLREKLGASLLLAPGLDVAGLLGNSGGSFTSAAVPSSLVKSVETVVMASIGAKSISGVAVLILVLLLAGGAGVGAWVVLGAQQRQAENRELVSRTNGRGDTRDPRDDPRGSVDAGDKPADNGMTGRDSTLGDGGAKPAGTTTTPQPTDTTPPVKLGEFVAQVSGRVINGSKAGVPGITVCVVPASKEDLLGITTSQDWEKAMPVEISGQTVSDDNGNFALSFRGKRELNEGMIHFALTATRDASRGAGPEFAFHHSSNMWVPPGQELSGIVIELSAPGAIEGRLVRASKPETGVPGRDICLCSAWFNSPQFLQDAAYKGAVVTTDAEGRFQFTGLPPGQYQVGPPNRYGKTAGEVDLGDTTQAKVDAGKTTSGIVLHWVDSAITFRTSPAVAKLGGEVRHADPNAAVMTDWGHNFHTMPAKDGLFTLRGVRPTATRLRIWADGVGSAELDIKIAMDEHKDLGVIEFKPGPVVEGKVVDADGKPVAADVMLWTDGFKYGVSTVQSGPDGTFRIVTPHEGKGSLTAMAGSLRAKNVEVEYAAGKKPAFVTLTLPSDSVVALRGSVTVGGKPPGFLDLGAASNDPINIAVFPADKLPRAFAEEDLWNAFDRTNVSVEATYKIRWLEPGDYYVIAALRGRAAVSPRFTYKGDEHLEINLDVPEGGSVKGRIIGRDGNPMAGIPINLSSYSYRSFSFSPVAKGVTDHNGEYLLEGVNPGSYFLRIEGDGDMLNATQLSERVVAVKNGQVSEKNLDFAANGGASIAGHVTCGGAAVFRQAVLVEPGKMASLRSDNIDANGNFSVNDVAPGKYYLWFADNKFNPRYFVRQVVEIKDGETKLTIEKDFVAASCSGTVTVQGAPEGFKRGTITVKLAPVLEETIGVDPVAMMASWSTTCSGDGEFKFDQFVGGLYNLVVTAPGLAGKSLVHDMRGIEALVIAMGDSAGAIELKVKEIVGDATAGAVSENSPMARLALVSCFDAEGKVVTIPDHQRMLHVSDGATMNLTSLAPGTYRIEVVSILAEKWTANVTVVEGQTSKVAVSLTRASTICLKVQNLELDAATVQSATVEVFDADGRRVTLGGDLTSAFGLEAEAVTTKVLRLTPLAAGTYRVVVKLDGYRPHEVTVAVARSSVSEQDITLMK